MAPLMGARGAKRRTHRKTLVRAAVFMALLGVGLLYSIAPRPNLGAEPTMGSRRLQSNNTSVVVVPANTCTDLLDNGFDGAPVLAMIVYVLLMLWVFLGIAVVCDDYFCVSLEVICEQLQLSEAVAGATFMAAGSSAPELATSLVATFTTRDATGLGTILGSAVFNLVAIICLSGIFGAGPTHKLTQGHPEKKEIVEALEFTKKLNGINEQRVASGGAALPEGLYLDWRPLGRDAAFYIFALALCVVFALTSVGDGWEDPQFNNKPGFLWWEGLLLCLCYGVYIHSMIVDEELMTWMREKVGMSDHIALYLDELEKMDDDDDDDANGPDEEQPHKTTHWHGGTGAALGRMPAGNSPRPGRQGGTTTAETDGLLDKPDVEAPAAPGQDTENGAPEEVVSIDSVTLQSAVIKTNTHLEQKILALKAKVEQLEEQNKKPYKWEYKAMEAEEEEDSFMDKCIGFAGKPWELAFQITIPPCDRDAFQKWDDKPIAFKDIDVEGQEIIRKEREKANQELPTDTEGFYKGKYKKTRVDLWYEQSKVYILAFSMSIVWIGITSWAMVSIAEKIGCHLNVGPFIMGLVVLAAGTSIPDALSSIVVAKQGDGDMACANAVGSNVFNIFLGIGLPMMLSEWVWGEPFIVPDGLPVLISTLMLITITTIMYIGICFNNWILTIKLSWILLTMFPLYLLLCILFEGNTIPLYDNLCSNEVGHALACAGLNNVNV